MAVPVKPLGITHFLMGLTWGSVLVGINAIEFYFLGKSTSQLDVLWIVMQNIGIASANSYYMSKIDMTPQGITETTTK
ncbi:MAG: hypothetical protein QXW39_09540 [Candidatus Bathyarchaeia archaeon]